LEDYTTVAFDMATGQRLWVANYDGPGHYLDEVAAVKVSPDGAHVYVTGSSVGVLASSSESIAYEYATISYDAATGAQQWVSRFNGNTINPGVMQSAAARARAIEVAPDGSRIYITGQSYGALGDIYATVAYEASTGSQLWVATYKGVGGTWSNPTAITGSPDGTRLFVTGVSASLTNAYDYVTVAYNSASGAQLWTATYDGPYTGDGYDEAVAIAGSPDGSRVYVTGFSTAANGYWDYATISYDASSGSEQWVGRYAGPGNAYNNANSIRVSPDGKTIFVAGENFTPIDDQHATGGYPTVAYDAMTGAQKWVAIYPGPDNSSYSNAFVTVSPDSRSVYVVQLGANDNGNFVTTSYNADTGAQQWVTQYSGPAGGLDLPAGIAITSDGSAVVVVGTSAGSTTWNDFAVARYASANGTQEWAARYDGPGVNDESPMATVVSPDSATVYVSGYSDNGTNLGLDYVTAAYDTATGQQRWVERYHRGDSSYEINTGMAINHNGQRVYVTGYTNAPGNGTPSEYTTVAYDAATGGQIWVAMFTKPTDSDLNLGYPYAIAVSPDDKRVYVTGNVSGSKGGFTSYDQIGTIACDAASGALLWAGYFDGVNVAWRMGVTPDGERVIVSAANGNGATSVAYDALTGAQQWTANWSSIVGNRWSPYAVAASPDNSSVFITGPSYSPVTGVYSYLTVAYDAATGTEKWEKFYAGSAGAGDLPAYGIAVSPDSARVYVTGLTTNNTTGGDYGTVAYDAATGTQLWVANYDNDLGADLGTDIAVTPDNSLVVVTGQSDGTSLSRDYATVFYDAATGTQKLVARYDGPASGYDVGARLSVSTDSSRVFVTGVSPGLGTGDDIATLAYDTSIIGIAPPPPVSLTRVVSRKIHGDAGLFDIDLTGGSGIECRSGGADRQYTLVFNFPNALTNVGGANLTSGSGAVTTSGIGADSHQYIVSLSGVANAQLLTLTLVNVNDAAGHHSNSISTTFGILTGDVNASRRVDAADVSAVRQQTLQPVDSTNFRNDVNASGRIDAADVSIVRQQTLTSLP
jgi:hypothetical protein